MNAGKSKRNEDNAHIHVGSLYRPGEGAGDAAGRSVPYYYFGVFDGHAGHGASTAAANQLHHIVHVSRNGGRRPYDVFSVLVRFLNCSFPHFLVIVGYLLLTFLGIDILERPHFIRGG